MILSSPALPRIRKPPSPSTAIPGSGVVASRAHLVVRERALSPNPFAQRSISGMPIGIAAELMTDLLRVDPDALEAQQHDQRGKTWIRH